MIQEKLHLGYTYLIYDESIGDEPIEATDMEILDSEGVGTGEYHSINSLSAEMGNAFVPVPYLKAGFKLIHLSFGLGTETGDTDYSEWVQAIEKLLTTDMRLGIRNPDDVDYDAVTLDSWGFFSAWEVKSVPKWIE